MCLNGPKLCGLTALCAAVISLLGGCGGDGTSYSGAQSRTRSRVQQSMGFNLRSMAFSGSQGSFQAGQWSQGNSQSDPGGGGGSVESGGGAGFVGGFMVNVAFQNAGFGRGYGRAPGRDGGGTGGEPGGDGGGYWNGESGFYFDEWLGLWVDATVSATEVSFLLYEDEAKQLSAGFILSSYPSEWSTFPQEYHSSYQILAGLMQGSQGRYELVLLSETDGSLDYENTSQGGYHDIGSAHWGAEGYIWSSLFEAPEGVWYRDSGEFHPDGSGSTVFENSFGYRGTFTYNADGTGHGLIEGPDPGLPATLTWDETGKVTIRWADGRVEEFYWWTCVEQGGNTDPGEPPGGGGGSGGGGGGNGGDGG